MPFPVDIRYVRRAEDKLGRKLPLNYVAQMCRSNGGELAAGPDVWSLHPVFDDSDKTRLKRTSNDLVRETASAKQWPGFPEHALAIGSNGSGDLLVFVAEPSSDRYGDEVFWWDHETGELNKVADDFLDLAGLV